MSDFLKSWGLLNVTIQNNKFIGRSVPTTQEDNYGQIVDKIDLYHIPEKLLNGTLADIKDGKIQKVGRLVKYMDNSYSVFHGKIRYNNLTEVRINHML